MVEDGAHTDTKVAGCWWAGVEFLCVRFQHQNTVRSLGEVGLVFRRLQHGPWGDGATQRLPDKSIPAPDSAAELLLQLSNSATSGVTQWTKNNFSPQMAINGDLSGHCIGRMKCCQLLIDACARICLISTTCFITHSEIKFITRYWRSRKYK